MKNVTILVLSLFAGVFLASCQGDLASEYGVKRDEAVYLAAGQPRTLDPALTHASAGGIVGHLFSGLVTLDTDLQVQPELAIGWDVSEDGTTYTFFLHPNARFHDGRSVSAEDVIYSWERALDPTLASDTALTYLGDIVGAKAVADGNVSTLTGVSIIDDKTLAVTIDAPKPYFLAKLTYPVSYIVDRHYVGQPDWQYAPNGTGSFKMTVWRDDEIIILERNHDYYGSSGNVEHVVYWMGAGLSLAMYEQGQIDLTGIGGGSLARVQDPNDVLSADLRTQVSLCTTFIGLNHRIPPFNDVRVRQAFNYALDKDRLINGIYQNNALPATGILPPAMSGHTPLPGYRFDPDLAQELLIEAGYTEPLTLTYTASGYGNMSGLATAVIAMWQENLNVNIVGDLVEPYRYSDQLYAGEVGNLFNFGWCADYADPENFLDILFYTGSAQNLTGYSNPDLDQLLESARIEPDPAQRLTLYAEIEQQLLDEAPYVFVAHSLAHILVSPRLDNYEFTPIGIPQWHQVNLTSD